MFDEIRQIKYFLRDMPLASWVDFKSFIKRFIKTGYHENHLRKKSLQGIRSDRFVNYLCKEIDTTEHQSSQNEIINSLKIRLLITINGLDKVGGTEVWLSQMLKELRQRDVECLVFTEFKGEISSELEKQGFSITSDISSALAFNPDLVHLQHCTNKNISNLMNSISTAVPVFNLVHGVAPKLEAQYVHSGRNIAYGGVSELVVHKTAFITNKKASDIHLIRNFFNQKDIPSQNKNNLSRIAIVSSKLNKKQINSWKLFFPKHAEKISFFGNSKKNRIADYAKVIDDYDLFFCSGKTAIDLLGFGKAVILLEGDLMGPAVTSDNIVFLSALNFALANPLIPAVAQSSGELGEFLQQEMEKIKRDNHTKLKSKLLQYNSLQEACNQLLNIYQKLLPPKPQH